MYELRYDYAALCATTAPLNKHALRPWCPLKVHQQHFTSGLSLLVETEENKMKFAGATRIRVMTPVQYS